MNMNNIDAQMHSIESMSNFVNRYGFMIVFSVIVLGIITICAWKFLSYLIKKAEKDSEIAEKERLSYIEQQKDLLKMVTENNTEHVAELRKIGSTLDAISTNTSNTFNTTTIVEKNIEDIEKDLNGLGSNYNAIKGAVDEIYHVTVTNLQKIAEILEELKMMRSGLEIYNMTNGKIKRSLVKNELVNEDEDK